MNGRQNSHDFCPGGRGAGGLCGNCSPTVALFPARGSCNSLCSACLLGTNDLGAANLVEPDAGEGPILGAVDPTVHR